MNAPLISTLLTALLCLHGTAWASGQALLVGASAPSEGPALPGAQADVAAVRSLLVETYGYPEGGVRTLVGADATVAAIDAALTEMVDASQRDAPVVVYYAGAGAQIADANQDEPDPWDEAWAVADGWVLDDLVHARLEALAARSGHVTYVVDASVRKGDGTARRTQTRWAGRHTPELVNVDDDALGVGDGAAAWASTRIPGLTVVDAARLGPALETKRGGVFTRVLLASALRGTTWGSLEDRLVTKTASRSPQVPSVRGVTDSPVFGRAGVGEELPPMTRFEIPDGGITVTIQAGNRPDSLPARDAKRLTKAIERDRDISRRVQVVADGDWLVRRDPASRKGALQILGPEGGVRNTVATDAQRDALDKVAENLWLHGQQAALLDMEVPRGPIRVRMVPLADDAQSPCAKGRWRRSEPNTEQLVPMCWRWQVEVQLRRDAAGPMEVGGVILGNDGTLLGFPFDGNPVVLEPGAMHRFRLQRPGRQAGLRSVPPLEITEHVLVFGTPVGTGAKFNEVSGWASRNVGGARGGVDGAWVRAHVPFRVIANPNRPDVVSRDPTEQVRELTLPGFDVTPYLPANPQSLTYRLLQNAERLATFKGADGLSYAQCWPEGSSAINNRSRFSETAWPGGSCWSEPYDFSRDNAELGDSPGIDCSTAMWFVFTRVCQGNTRLDVPQRASGERNAEFQARLRTFHTEDRRCLLFTDEDFRGGFVNTAIMANRPEIMAAHWSSCLGEPLQTGDVLVTRNARDTSGHTYMVVDPDRFVVFGSHAADMAWSKLTPEERELWEAYEEVGAASRDAGVEYQFLTWHNKRDLQGTALEKWAGFSSERLKACWRHKAIVAEWETDPSSRPGSGDMMRICEPERCR